MNSYLLLTKTQDKDQFGGFVLKLQYFKNGLLKDTINCCSGQPNKQFFRKGSESKAGSGEPLPEGRWYINDILWAGGKDNYTGAIHADGIGPVTIPLDYMGAAARKGIEAHIDWNRKGAPGTIGCVGFYNIDDFKRLVQWLRDSDPRDLFVDWKLGSCPTPGAPASKLPQCGINLIKEFEGCYLEAYPDPLSGGKPYTIGWGSTKKRDGSEWKPGDQITQQEADSLLLSQLERNYLPPLEKIPCWGRLNENQKGALLSFAYNLGAHFYGAQGFNSITKMLSTEDWSKARETFIKYRNPGTNVEEGLKRRRIAEANLFLSS